MTAICNILTWALRHIRHFLPRAQTLAWYPSLTTATHCYVAIQVILCQTADIVHQHWLAVIISDNRPQACKVCFHTGSMRSACLWSIFCLIVHWTTVYNVIKATVGHFRSLALSAPIVISFILYSPMIHRRRPSAATQRRHAVRNLRHLVAHDMCTDCFRKMRARRSTLYYTGCKHKVTNESLELLSAEQRPTSVNSTSAMQTPLFLANSRGLCDVTCTMEFYI